jgi:hypothetical protein
VNLFDPYFDDEICDRMAELPVAELKRIIKEWEDQTDRAFMGKLEDSTLGDNYGNFG